MSTPDRRRTWYPLVLCVLLVSVAVLGPACTPAGTGPGDNGTDGGTDTGDGNTLLNEASGFEGTLSGKVLDQQSTRASTVDASAAQDVPPDIDTENTTVTFLDVTGEVLVDENGETIPPVSLEPDGTFTADGLPVGVDFTVCVDIGKDGKCDVESCVNIPNDNPADPGVGHADGVQVDPLTTLVLAKLHALVAEGGLNPADLPISPVALVARVVEAYTHLFEELGIDQQVTLEDIEALTDEQLASLFDEIIPDVAQTGMKVARGNLALARASDVNAAALAAAEVFLRAGFPVADTGDPLDLSSLASLPDVEVTTMGELFEKGDPLREDFEEVSEDFAVAPAQLGNAPVEPTVYISTVAEPDRNFSDEESDVESAPGPHLPVINDFLLVQMAQLQLEGRRLTIAQLHEVLTSLDTGLGARLTYFIHDPNFFGPPATVFETADGAGRAIVLDQIFGRIAAEGFQELSPEQLQEHDRQLRQVLAELLADTVAPSLDRLAGAFLTDRIGDVNDFAAHIRDARAHLPHSRTGPSTFFVVADGDPLRSEGAVSPVTVDATVSSDGTVGTVTYNPNGEGKFYLMFTDGTQGEGLVSLLVREAGRPLHGPRGPLRLNLHDNAVFAPVNGEPFAEFVSETGSFFPGINVAVVSSNFVPAPAPLPTEVRPAGDEPSGPNQQIFVLATAPGPEGEPVRVDYDTATGVATYNAGGRFLLQFTPETEETGQFLLFNEQTGRPAGQEDPANFFMPPPPAPPPPDGPFNPPPADTTPITDPNAPPPTEGEIGTPPPPGEGGGGVQPSQFPGGSTPPEGSMPPPGALPPGAILVSIDAIAGLPVSRQNFTHVFGTEVANARYNADGDPYFDDINGNGLQDADEPTAPFRPTLFNASDWRSTDIRLYYRRSDNHAAVTFDDVAFDSDTPSTIDGVDLVARNFLPRLNAFRFGRPNTALNLLLAFLPPEFFDGTHGLTAETTLDVFGAIAVINLMMDQVHNVQANVDPDGVGPLTSKSLLIDAHIFVPPVGDPFVLLLNGFRELSVPTVPTGPTEPAPTDTTLSNESTAQPDDSLTPAE